MAAEGLVKGDRLALLSHNCWQFAVLSFAAARLGVKRLTGAARFVNGQRIALGDELVAARNFVLATGSRPYLPEMLRGSNSEQ